MKVGERVYPAASLVGGLENTSSVLGLLRDWDAAHPRLDTAAKNVDPKGGFAFSDLQLLAPILYPGALFCAGAITGAPISWLLGGNPFLDGVWLFANGVICFHQGYKFFMIALADQEEVNRVVREIKGLLPAA